MTTVTPAPPTLDDLKHRQCSPGEVQAALVKLIELHNALAAKVDELYSAACSREISQHNALKVTEYGL